MTPKLTHQAAGSFLVQPPIELLLALRIRRSGAPASLFVPLGTNHDPLPKGSGADERQYEMPLWIRPGLKSRLKQAPASGLGGSCDFARFLHGHGQRSFAVNMLVSFECSQRDLFMLVCRGCNDDRLDILVFKD